MESKKTSDHQIRYPVREKSAAVADIRFSNRELTIDWQDGHQSRFNRFWLRDNCPSAGNKMTAIRHFQLRQMGDDTAIKNAQITDEGEIQVDWLGDSHISIFKPRWLRQHCYEQSSCAERLHRPILWDASINQSLPTVDFHGLNQGSAQHLHMLQQLTNYGVVRVINLPVTDQGIEELEPLLSPFTENDFGRVFDLISEPDVWDLSQSTEALDPHTDDPYRYAPPGIRILFCLEASGEGGGLSEIANGIAACEKIKRTDPAAFKLLSSTPIPYIRYRENAIAQAGDVHLRANAPVITVDAQDNVIGVRFHERSMATFDLPADIVDNYYQALIELSKVINSGDYSIKHQLKPGEAFVFDNHQVLHGRTAFTGKPGRRHLRLCQMDRDLVHSRYRLLLSQHGEFGAADTLSAGV